MSRQIWNKSRVLITGGLGFIGSNLAMTLVKMGADATIVDSLDKNCGGNINNIRPIQNKINLKIYDLNDRRKLASDIKDNDIIFNLAGQTSHTKSMSDPLSDLRNNLQAHIELLEACRTHNLHAKVIYTGTRSEYGKSEYLPVDERHPTNPTDVNGINKLAAEKYHLLYGFAHGMNVCCLRIANTYGERHQMKTGDGFVNWFARQAIDGKPISIFGNGDSLRDVIYVGDVVECLIKAAEDKKSNGQIYNVGSGMPIKIRQIAEQIVKEIGYGKINFVKYPRAFKKIEIGDFYCSLRKIKKEISWKPKTSFSDGIANTIRFYRENKSDYWSND